MTVATDHPQRLKPGPVESLSALDPAPAAIPVPRRPGAAGSSRPAGSEDGLHRATRALLVVFAVFTALAVVALLVLAARTQTFFAWPIQSRPNAHALGAAYAAGFVLSVVALRQRRWSSVRIPVATVTVFTVLTLFPTLFHMHRLNLMADAGTARAAACVWLSVYLLVPIAGGIVLVRQHRAGRPARSTRQRGRALPERRMPGALVAVLVAQGAAMAAAGTVLYAGGASMHRTMDMQKPGWAWPVTPLTSMVIGAWLLSFAVAIAFAVREGDLARMLVPAVAYAAFGAFELVGLLVHRTAPGTDVVWWSAGVVLAASLVPTGVYGAVASRRGGGSPRR
jgi:hypothetical protein